MKQKKLNCERARNICTLSVLAKFQHFPVKISEKEAWFLSPFRSETQASFKVNLRTNSFIDFGDFTKGDVITLVCLLLKCSVSDSLEFLSNKSLSIPFRTPKPKLEHKRSIKIKNYRTLQHQALKDYLISRKISVQTTHVFCKEVWYRCQGSLYFAIGLQNHKGGWELRNERRKNCSSPKSFTYLGKSFKELIILEGMFDLLSLYEIDKLKVNTCDIIVLNSLAFLPEVESNLKKYHRVFLYLDNDSSGNAATQKLLQGHDNVSDMSDLYKDYKDLNDFLVWS